VAVCQVSDDVGEGVVVVAVVVVGVVAVVVCVVVGTVVVVCVVAVVVVGVVAVVVVVVGTGAVTTAVGADVATVEPFLFVAMTATASVEPTSAELSVYA
jgi:hypothetical protein